MTEVSIEEFLRESNAIERVHSDAAYEDARAAWEYISDQEMLSHEVIKTTHELLLANRQPQIAGEYRDVRVRVGGDLPPAPTLLDELMTSLLEQRVTTGFDAIDWHVQFEKIHPFEDGNGRVGRLVYLWHCVEHLNIDPVMWRADDVAGYYALFRSERNPKTE